LRSCFTSNFGATFRADRFIMEFVLSAPAALGLISDAQGVSLILILSDINMPGVTGLEFLPVPRHL
jgi:CheY-like chemotaxis protein